MEAAGCEVWMCLINPLVHGAICHPGQRGEDAPGTCKGPAHRIIHAYCNMINIYTRAVTPGTRLGVQTCINDTAAGLDFSLSCLLHLEGHQKSPYGSSLIISHVPVWMVTGSPCPSCSLSEYSGAACCWSSSICPHLFTCCSESGDP